MSQSEDGSSAGVSSYWDQCQVLLGSGFLVKKVQVKNYDELERSQWGGYSVPSTCSQCLSLLPKCSRNKHFLWIFTLICESWGKRLGHSSCSVLYVSLAKRAIVPAWRENDKTEGMMLVVSLTFNRCIYKALGLVLGECPSRYEGALNAPLCLEKFVFLKVCILILKSYDIWPN